MQRRSALLQWVDRVTALTALMLLLSGRTALGGPNVWTTNGPGGGFVSALVLHPSNPSELFAATSRGVYKSADGGMSWAPMNQGLPPYVNSLVLSSSDTLYAATNGIYKSSDGGRSWTQLDYRVSFPFPYAPTVLAVDPSDPFTIYAGHCGVGVRKTTDGGATWLPTGPSGPNIVAFAFDPSSPRTVYAADAGGCGVFPSGIHTESASTPTGGVFKTTDGGTHWEPFNHGLTSGYVLSLAIDFSNTSTLYAGTAKGVFKSSDGGSSWRPSNTGLGEREVYAFSLDPFNPSIIYAGTPDGIYKSLDGGENWGCWNRGLGGRSIRALAKPPAPDLLYAGTYGGGVYKTADAGASWSAANGDLRQANVISLAIDPSTPAVVYAGLDGGGVFRSMDGGNSWIWANTGLTDTFIHSLAVDPSAPETVYAATGRGVFQSGDGARSWSATALARPVFIVRSDPVATGTLYAAAEEGVYRSINGGHSWTFGSAGLPEPRSIYGIVALEIDAANPSTLYASTYNSGEIFRSTDRGTTWFPLGTGFRNGVFSLAIDFRQPSTIYAGALNGVYLSRDGGRTWMGPVGPRERISSLQIDSSTLSGVYASADCFTGTPSDCGGVFRTIDGGQNWTRMNEGLTESRVNAVTIDQTGTYLYAATKAGVFSRSVGFSSIRTSHPRTAPRSVTPL